MIFRAEMRVDIFIRKKYSAQMAAKKPARPRMGRPPLPPEEKLQLIATTIPPRIRRVVATMAAEFGVSESAVLRASIDLRKAEKLLGKRGKPTSGIEPLTYGLRNPGPAPLAA
jgi:hypothetical protein